MYANILACTPNKLHILLAKTGYKKIAFFLNFVDLYLFCFIGTFFAMKKAKQRMGIMAFTQADYDRQTEEIKTLSDELSTLNEEFERQKKQLGITNDSQLALKDSEITPELKRAMEEAMEKAKSEGRSRAASARTEQAQGPAISRRRGAMRI